MPRRRCTPLRRRWWRRRVASAFAGGRHSFATCRRLGLLLGLRRRGRLVLGPHLAVVGRRAAAVVVGVLGDLDLRLRARRLVVRVGGLDSRLVGRLRDDVRFDVLGVISGGLGRSRLHGFGAVLRLFAVLLVAAPLLRRLLLRGRRVVVVPRPAARRLGRACERHQQGTRRVSHVAALRERVSRSNAAACCSAVGVLRQRRLVHGAARILVRSLAVDKWSLGCNTDYVAAETS